MGGPPPNFPVWGGAMAPCPPPPPLPLWLRQFNYVRDQTFIIM